jgi:hypothetical protein
MVTAISRIRKHKNEILNRRKAFTTTEIAKRYGESVGTAEYLLDEMYRQKQVDRRKMKNGRLQYWVIEGISVEVKPEIKPATFTQADIVNAFKAGLDIGMSNSQSKLQKYLEDHNWIID